MRAFAVALTGGIAAGKSAATARFAQAGVPVFDADLAARVVVEPGQPALEEIVATYGAEVLAPDGTLDRTRMRARIFADATARRRLEAILHPRIHMLLFEQARGSAAPYCIVAIPLFAETHENYRWVDRVLVIDVPCETQIARLVQRLGIDRGLAANMLSAQADRETRLKYADDVIDNSAALPALDSAVARLHRYYLRLAAQRLR